MKIITKKMWHKNENKFFGLLEGPKFISHFYAKTKEVKLNNPILVEDKNCPKKGVQHSNLCI